MMPLARLAGGRRAAALPARPLPPPSSSPSPSLYRRRRPNRLSAAAATPPGEQQVAAVLDPTTTTTALKDEPSNGALLATAAAAAAEDPLSPPTTTTRTTTPIAPPPNAATPTPPNPLAPALVYASIVDDPGLVSLPITIKTWVRAVLSGCYIAFGGLVAVAVVGASPALVAGAPGLARLVFALVFPVGLLLNLTHGGELLTGNTFRGTAAVMGGTATLPQLAKNWAVAFSGNFLGSLLVLALVLAAGLFPAGSPAAAFAQSLGDAKMALPFGQALCRAVLANWLVCLAVWQASSARTASDRFFAVWPPIAAFVAAGLEHSVANMFLVPLGLALSADGAGGVGGLTAASFARFCAGNLAPVTLGNALAGAAVVAGASHVVYGGGRKRV